LAPNPKRAKKTGPNGPFFLFSKKSCKNNIFSVKLRQKVNNKNDKEMRLKTNEICNR